ncbi:MAG: tetratricopeptide repeat protein [Bryobacterales bacterium]|nr:tetratricopeptide repeat protein [Bryobacterales bacterium]
MLLVVYGPSLRGEFLFDDIALKFRAEPEYFRWTAWQAMQGDRPLTGLSYWLSFHAGGGKPLPFHSASLLLHAASASLMGYIVFRLLTLLGMAVGYRASLALLGAGLFLLHPAQSEAVVYVAAHPEPLTVCFYFAAIALFLSAVLLALDLWVYRKPLPALLREGWRLYTLLAAGVALGVAVVLRTLSTATTAGFAMQDLQWWEYLLTQGRAILLYLRLWLLPVGQNGDYLFPISRGLFEHWAILCWALIAAGLAAAFRYRQQTPLVWLGALLFLLVLAPTSSVLPIQDAAVERRIYLAALGLVPLTLGLLLALRIPPAWMRAGGVAVLLVLSVATYQRSQVWASGNAFWADVLAKNPESWRANVAIGLQALEANRCQEALTLLEKAQPGVAANFQASWHANHARALDCLGRMEEAEAAYLRSLQGERSAAVLSQLGVHYGKRERYGDALRVLDEAIALDPGFPPAYSNRGNIHARQGDCSSAVTDFQQALRLMPGNAAARRGLAYCQQQAQ